MSHVKYWKLSNCLANTAVAILKVFDAAPTRKPKFYRHQPWKPKINKHSFLFVTYFVLFTCIIIWVS